MYMHYFFSNATRPYSTERITQAPATIRCTTRFVEPIGKPKCHKLNVMGR